MTEKKFPLYAALITDRLAALFDENDEDFHFDIEEMSNNGQLTEFIFALACVVPAHFYNNITGDEKDYMEFNHLANRLCFQFCERNGENKDATIK